MIRALGDAIAPRGIGSGRLCIVNYHRVMESFDPLLDSEPDVDTFRWQMELLAECFNVLPLHAAVQSLVAHRMPPRAVCITFDDGYASTHDVALPILSELKLPATVFVTTGYLDQGVMWNDKIIEAVRHLPGERLDLRAAGLAEYSLRTIDDRKQTIQRLTEDSKYLPPAARHDLTLRLQDMAGGVRTDGLMLTREKVCKLAQAGIEIGAHTISHPILTSLEDEAAREEIAAGKEQLEAITGRPVRLFAYPNGKAGMDFDTRHVAMAREAGFDAAFTTAIGAATKGHDRYQIPRSRPWDATPFRFGARLLRWLAR
ncbi:polysaccharide deacetylase [Noviherbaspirillum cavernae]|uniref:Polysaccharide deacetylase n=1 Tax=Noviherbaspirillum cavernae TaxID=2320862 RepID=A0A418X3J8_9BURK|nr:polysaccharide deacetylase family protein [Noviherbaspirillum cavernae]RJG07042.1 polysaccharide deacetylase [Noviherbaspirillum cavernae]